MSIEHQPTIREAIENRKRDLQDEHIRKMDTLMQENDIHPLTPDSTFEDAVSYAEHMEAIEPEIHAIQAQIEQAQTVADSQLAEHDAAQQYLITREQKRSGIQKIRDGAGRGYITPDLHQRFESELSAFEQMEASDPALWIWTEYFRYIAANKERKNQTTDESTQEKKTSIIMELPERIEDGANVFVTAEGATIQGMEAEYLNIVNRPQNEFVSAEALIAHFWGPETDYKTGANRLSQLRRRAQQALTKASSDLTIETHFESGRRGSYVLSQPKETITSEQKPDIVVDSIVVEAPDTHQITTVEIANKPHLSSKDMAHLAHIINSHRAALEQLGFDLPDQQLLTHMEEQVDPDFQNELSRIVSTDERRRRIIQARREAVDALQTLLGRDDFDEIYNTISVTSPQTAELILYAMEIEEKLRWNTATELTSGLTVLIDLKKQDEPRLTKNAAMTSPPLTEEPDLSITVTLHERGRQKQKRLLNITEETRLNEIIVQVGNTIQQGSTFDEVTRAYPKLTANKIRKYMEYFAPGERTHSGVRLSPAQVAYMLFMDSEGATQSYTSQEKKKILGLIADKMGK